MLCYFCRDLRGLRISMLRSCCYLGTKERCSRASFPRMGPISLHLDSTDSSVSTALPFGSMRHSVVAVKNWKQPEKNQNSQTCQIRFCVSSSVDQSRILFEDLWDVYGECENFHVMKGHSGAVMDLHFSTDAEWVCLSSWALTISGIFPPPVRVSVVLTGYTGRNFRRMYTASTDKTIGVWDMTTGEKIKKLKGAYVSFRMKWTASEVSKQWIQICWMRYAQNCRSSWR